MPQHKNGLGPRKRSGSQRTTAGTLPQNANIIRSTIICAIYTRKSSEEGLEQGFNSLDAQREACEAYVLSQQHEGWRLREDRYDDGGYSGGTLVRPALQRLLEDIALKRVQVVVVYKVDRLTRSLADFAKIVERFDAQGVSFVSVTQQFNTTSSMGRLTLNVLLSFAQFEREVTGERIRDKIAASKQKGLWMGGIAPMGYRAEGSVGMRTLVIDEVGASLIRHIYSRYLALGCVRSLKQELDAACVVTPGQIAQSGRVFGGRPFSRGQLYRMLSHPIYLGQTVHHDQVYAGQHAAIVDEDLWEAVQVKLAENRQGYQARRSSPSSSLLTGLVVDGQGQRLVPSHSQKQSRRYRYYVSEPLITGVREAAPAGMRLPAQELETVVLDALGSWLTDANAMLSALEPTPAAIQGLLARAKSLAHALEAPAQHDAESSLSSRTEASAQRYAVVQALVERVVVLVDAVQIHVRVAVLREGKRGKQPLASLPVVRLEVPVHVQRCGLSNRLLIQGSHQARLQAVNGRLIQQLAKGHDWLEQLTSGKVRSLGEIGTREGVQNSYVTHVIYRAFLAPDIVRAILAGTQPAYLHLEMLRKLLPLPVDWAEQRTVLGFPAV